MYSPCAKFFLKRRYKKIMEKHASPDAVQEYWFQKILEHLENTSYGKKYNLKENTSYSWFKKHTPIVTYEDIAVSIEKMLYGEKDVLCDGFVKWFAKSSGTTNAISKYIPVNKKILNHCHLKGGKDMLALYFKNYPDSHILKGKMIGITGSLQKPFSPSVSVGDISAVIVENLPFWAQVRRTPKKAVALSSDWNEKADKIISLTKNEDIRMLSGVPTWTAIILERLIEKYKVSSPYEIWPNLEAFFHGGVAFSPYKEYFKKLLGGRPLNYLETYNASEGFFAVQDDVSRDDMMLLLDNGVFYEFIPMKEFYNGSKNAIPISKVNIGETYALVITTIGGLTRYLIGDKIEITSTNPIRIKIRGRTKYFLNTFGEEIVIENVERALSGAQEKTGAKVKYFTVAPRFMSEGKSGSHEWLIEFDTAPENLDEFRDEIDNVLQSLNSDYKAKRAHDVIIKMPVITIAKKGLFEKWFEKKGKLGGQNKIPPLCNERTFLDEILSLDEI